MEAVAENRFNEMLSMMPVSSQGNSTPATATTTIPAVKGAATAGKPVVLGNSSASDEETAKVAKTGAVTTSAVTAPGTPPPPPPPPPQTTQARTNHPRSFRPS